MRLKTGWKIVSEIISLKGAIPLCIIKYILPYFSINNARVILQKRSKFVKNEHARYTLEIWNLKNLEKLITATSQARF